jgi:hypothetical protein
MQRKLTLKALAAGFAALVLTGAAQAATLTGPDTIGRDRGFTSLAVAVKAGRVDAGLIQTLTRKGEVNAIVTVNYRAAQGPGGSTGRSLLHRNGKALADRIARMTSLFTAQEADALGRVHGVQVLNSWSHLPTSYVRFHSVQALLEVANDPNVVKVSISRTVRAEGTAHLSYIRQTSLPLGTTGAGTYVAVLDTGVDFVSYGDFGTCPYAGAAGCSVAEQYESAGNDGQLDDPYANHRHGSNVAAIVHQVAPGTRILAFDVFTGTGDAARAPDWAIQNAIQTLIQRQSVLKRIVAANLSIGGTIPFDTCSGGIQGDLAALRNASILPVISAGNGARGGFGSYGVAYPSCLPEAMTVGATYDANVGSTYYSFHNCGDATTWADKVTCFSQTGRALDVLAPGADIQGGSGNWTGTSQAAPHVAGAIAVLAAARPSATMTAIESAIVNTGPTVSDRRYSTQIDRHRLDLVSALAALPAGTSTNAPPKPTLARRIAALETVDSANRTAPVKFSWSAAGATGYNVWVRRSSSAASINDATWVEDLTLANSTSVVYALTAGQTYQVAVRARNSAGVWSDYSYTTATVVIDDDPAWGTVPSWYRATWSPSFGGTEINATAAGTWFNYALNGTDAAWVAPMFSTAGQSRVSHDGIDDGVFDQYSATLKSRQTVYAVHFDQPGDHNVLIKVLGTPGRPQVDIDAFVVLR